ncbi:protein transport protein bos1 [Phlyctochytrium planicorne]|nr:protein transport protein bos1 [Phlyctochytrium planicorne]
MKLVNMLKSDLDQLEAGLESSTPHSTHTVSQVHTNLQNLKRAYEDIDENARREITTVKREKAKGRAAQVRDDYEHLKSRYEIWRQKDTAKTASLQRNELLGTAGITQRQGYGSESNINNTENKPSTDTSTILMMDGLLRENDVLHNAGDRLDDYINLGRTALQELYEQRTILKSTQRRVLDAFNTLGLSTTVIKYIEQRASQDKWILWGGIAVTIFVMWLILHYFRS